MLEASLLLVVTETVVEKAGELLDARVCYTCEGSAMQSVLVGEVEGGKEPRPTTFFPSVMVRSKRRQRNEGAPSASAIWTTVGSESIPRLPHKHVQLS